MRSRKFGDFNVMTTEQLFCQCICGSLYPEQFEFPQMNSEEFERITLLLKSHTLEPLVLGQIKLEKIPASLRTQCRKTIYSQKVNYVQYLYTQNQVLDAMKQANIPCVILKGTVSSSYYVNSSLRTLGDIDLLVQKKDEKVAAQCLRAMGFEHHEYFEDEFEQCYVKGQFQVELHTGFSPERQFGTHAAAINDYLLNGFCDIQFIKLEEYCFPSFSNERVGVLMLEHLHRHLRNNLGFRQVIDWMMYVDRCVDDVAWNKKMEKLFSRFGLKQFAMIITAMCQKYFGLRTDGIAWTQGVEDAVCDELFEHILSMGNFGRNLKSNQQGLAKRLRDHNLFSLLRFTQHVGLRTWKASQRYHLIKPFAWVYQIYRFLSHAKERNYDMSLSSIVEDRKRTKRVDKLMKELGL